VQKVDAEAVDLRAELRDRVDARLGGAPVVAVGPVGAEGLQIGERNALRGIGLALGPARAGEPLAKVGEVGVGDVETEGLQAEAAYA
jgi:hypothetical protein